MNKNAMGEYAMKNETSCFAIYFVKHGLEGLQDCTEGKGKNKSISSFPPCKSVMQTIK